MLVDVTLVQIILFFLTHLRHLRIVRNEHYACVRRFTNARIDMLVARGFFLRTRKNYYYLRVSIARFLITFTGNLDT